MSKTLTGKKTMSHVVMYATPYCPYCHMAKTLLANKGAVVDEINADDPNVWKDMAQLTGRNTVPQIFIGDRHVGGYDDLSAADRTGQLDLWLSDY